MTSGRECAVYSKLAHMRWIVPPAVVAIGLAATLHAQPRPDLSGTYRLTPSAEAIARGAEPLQIVIRQSAVELTVQRTTSRGESEFTYRLDGVETVESNMLGDVKVRAAWQGDTLVVTKTRTLAGPDGPADVTSTESYSRRDDTLTIETRQPAPDGSHRSQTVVVTKIGP